MCNITYKKRTDLRNVLLQGGLNNSTRKKLTTVEAARVVKTFTELGYIMNTR